MLFVDKSEAKEKKEEPSSSFQRHRVDLLLGELAKKFPPKVIPPTQPEVGVPGENHIEILNI
jgi:hypothetical protein